MRNGIYSVKFSSSTQDFGTGVIVVNNDTINGGDLGYLYTGVLTSQDDKLSGVVKVKRWNTSGVSVFGSLQEFDLMLTGLVVEKLIKLSGHVVGKPSMGLTASCEFLSDLA